MVRALQREHAQAEYQWAAEIVGRLDHLSVRDRMQLVEALAQVPREDFVDPAFASRVREDVSLPIGFRQTISRPSTVAQVLGALELQSNERVLEVGAGSGYLCAVLSRLNVEVFAVERIAPLAKCARACLDRLAFHVHLKVGDGLRGWQQFAPYDAIIVSAALKSEPLLLLAQLSEQGRLIAPMETEAGRQNLVLWRRDEAGVSSTVVGECQFVPAG